MSQHTIHSYFAKADENGDIAPAASSSASSSRSIPAILGGRKRKAVSAPNAPLLETEDVEDRRVLAAVQNVCINNASSSSSSRQPLSTLHSDNLTEKPRTVILGNRQPHKTSDTKFQLTNPAARRRLIAPTLVKVQQSEPSPANNTKPAPSKSTTSSSSIVPPPAKKLKMRPSWSQFREYIHTSSSQENRCPAPFPTLKWADRQEMWELICKKETGMYKRKSAEEIVAQHPGLQPKMRAILLDWLVEVCEVYRLHRETFYLAVDFFDRYLSITHEMPKNRLQLVGVTCLFIGAKIEEIYPPKLQEFAYVTDGACTEDEILNMELVVIKTLKWGLSPMTPNGWMKIFMQAINCDQSPENETFVLAQYSGLPYARAMQLLDLVTLDMSSLSFTYSVLAATAFAIAQDDLEGAMRVSGYSWYELAPCHSWMSMFWEALRAEGFTTPFQIKTFNNVSTENAHNIQSHTIDLKTLDKVFEIAQQKRLESPSYPRFGGATRAVITPPAVLETPPESSRDVKFKQYPTLKASFSSSSSLSTTTTGSSTCSASSVFFSPDSDNVAFINPDDLHKF